MKTLDKGFLMLYICTTERLFELLLTGAAL